MNYQILIIFLIMALAALLIASIQPFFTSVKPLKKW